MKIIAGQSVQLRAALMVVGLVAGMGSVAWAQGVPATPNKPAKSTSASAVTKKPAPVPEAPPAPGTMLTKEDLRVCLKDKDDILAQRARLEKDQAASQAERDQILAQTQLLKDAMSTLDRTAPGVLDAHDAKVDAHEKRIDAWNQAHRQMLSTIEALNKKQAQWTTDCGEKRYREEDELAIRSGK